MVSCFLTSISKAQNDQANYFHWLNNLRNERWFDFRESFVSNAFKVITTEIQCPENLVASNQHC